MDYDPSGPHIGGKIERSGFIHPPKDTQHHWFDIFEKTAVKEVLEETNVRIQNISYVSNLAFIRPNGFSTLIVSLAAQYASGNVRLSLHELTDHAWVTLEEAEHYDLIENILEQMRAVSRATLSKAI